MQAERYGNISVLLDPTKVDFSANNATAHTYLLPDFSDPATAAEAVILGLMVLLTVGGNLLVIAAVVTSAALRSPTHSLIVNLAVADLLLGVTVLPLSVARELAGGAWLFGESLCSIWTSLDVLCCTASILSLCGISVDRYIGVSRPLAYSRILTKRRVRCLIAGIWTLAIAISVASPLGWREEVVVSDGPTPECQVNKQLGYVIFSACGSFYIPALVIIALYLLVYRAAVRYSTFLTAGSRVTRSDVTLRVHMGSTRKTRQSICDPNAHQKMNSGSIGNLLVVNGCDSSADSWSLASEQGRRLTAAGAYGRAAKFRKQKKAAKTLGIVVGGFLLCWFPFFLILPIDASCSTCDLSVPFNLAFWLGYFNSCINPFIYACSSRELRRAFRSILCCRRRDQRRRSISVASFRQTIPVSVSSQTPSVSIRCPPT